MVNLTGGDKMSTKVFTVFLGKPEDEGGWPHVGFSCMERAEYLLSKLRSLNQHIDFVNGGIVYNPEDVTIIYNKLKEASGIDGVLIYGLGANRLIPSTAMLLDSGYPTILGTDVFGGDKFFLYLHDIARKKNVPSLAVSSLDIRELKEALDLIDILHCLKGQRILIIEDSRDSSDQAHFWRRQYEKYVQQAKNLFGIEVLGLDPKELLEYYKKQEEGKASILAQEWIETAQSVVEPTQREIIKSAKLYLAMKSLLRDKKAKVITIDCLSLFYAHKLPAYPCLGFWQLNNEGLLGVCQADLESAITQLVGQSLTKRPGFVSDPVFDTPNSKIIYAHCVAPTKVFGKERTAVPYKIRSHAEDRKGAALEALMPPGEVLTTVKINLLARKTAIHQAESVGSMETERGCRTKLVAKANVATILENWDFNTFGWHRVTFFGDFRRIFFNFARLAGLSIVEEDKEGR